mmetsp:Transcript_10967/g.15140  ORF Transcript_10967/g.15140 Transcript_10967/m.15140 type:complete len:309 (-) Transcript_10967:186-1112(-)
MASGFEGAPLSRVLFVSTTLQSFMLSASMKRNMGLDLGRVLAHGEVWRLFSHQLAFLDFGEALNGIVHIYWFRVLERMLGSRRFSCFLAITWTLSVSLATGAIVLLGDRREDGATYLRLMPGPYFFIFSMYSLYFSLVPPTRPRLAGIFGINISEKSLVYLAGTQLFFSSGLRTVIPGLSGFLAGAAYLSDALKLYTWTLPKWFDRWFFKPRRLDSTPMRNENPREELRERTPPAVATRVTRGDATFLNDDQAAIDAAMTAHAMASAEPSPDNIESLIAMGFDRDRSIEALRATGDNIEHAANRLLSS